MILLKLLLENHSCACFFFLVKFSDDELQERRQRALEMKQFLQDNKVI